MMNRIVTLVLVLATAACGFHLRGAYPLPAEMQRTFVEYSGTDTAVRSETVRALNLNDVRVVSSAASADAVLQLQRVSTQRDILSRDRNGRPQEYAITVSLAFAVRTPEGQVLVERNEVEAGTVLALDTTDPTATGSEVDAAVASLREDTVMQMIRAISAARPAAAGTE